MLNGYLLESGHVEDSLVTKKGRREGVCESGVVKGISALEQVRFLSVISLGCLKPSGAYHRVVTVFSAAAIALSCHPQRNSYINPYIRPSNAVDGGWVWDRLLLRAQLGDAVGSSLSL